MKEELYTLLDLDPGDAAAVSLVTTLYTNAEAYARRSAHLGAAETVPSDILIRMVMEDYGRLTGAGLSARTLSGMSEKYQSDYSPAVRAALSSIRHLSLPKEASL